MFTSNLTGNSLTGLGLERRWGWVEGAAETRLGQATAFTFPLSQEMEVGKWSNSAELEPGSDLSVYLLPVTLHLL